MKNYVEFGMIWQVTGKQMMELPPEIDPADKTAVIQYIKSIWNEIPIPTDGEYLSGSDELDETILEIKQEYDDTPGGPIVMEKEIRIPRTDAEFIRKLQEKEPKSKEECFGEDRTIEYGASFNYGYKMAIQLCGVQYEPDGINFPWTQAVLFDERGRECCHTWPCEDFFGEWELSYDGVTYKVTVIEENEQETALRKFAENQWNNQLNDKESLVSFEYEDQEIVNPFIDPSGRFNLTMDRAREIYGPAFDDCCDRAKANIKK